jgi:uncharacterized membrane protein YeiH
MTDAKLGETPVVLRRDLYAIPAILGAAIVAVAHAAGRSAVNCSLREVD